MKRDLYTHVYSIIHNRQGVEAIQVLINRQVDKQTVVYTNTRIFKYLIEYLKRKEILAHATTWMNLEAITFCEISQSEEDKYYMIQLICGT